MEQRGDRQRLVPPLSSGVKRGAPPGMVGGPPWAREYRRLAPCGWLAEPRWHAGTIVFQARINGDASSRTQDVNPSPAVRRYFAENVKVSPV